MVRPPYFDSNGMKKGAWSEEEDNKLRDFIQTHGHVSNWRLLPILAGLPRCGKSCRLRWMNYLKPGLKRGNFSKHERDLIIKLHAQLGNKWSAIAANLPGRTDNEVKNYWHAHIQKRNKRKGGVTKVIETTPMLKEKQSCSEISFCNIGTNQNGTPPNNIVNWQDLSVVNPENIDAFMSSAAQTDQGNTIMTHEEYCQTRHDLPPFAEEAEVDNFWLCQEMQNNNMSVFFESSGGGYSTAESQLGDFWVESLGEEAISLYFGDIINMLQDS